MSNCKLIDINEKLCMSVFYGCCHIWLWLLCVCACVCVCVSWVGICVGMRPLHYAAWQGKTEPMKMLLKAGSSVNGQSDEGQIPLHLSAQHGHYDGSEMLLQHQSNPCISDAAGKTPLDLACEFGRVAVVQLLLSSNMCAAMLEPKPSDPNGVSPLHLAAKNGHIDVIRLLIQAGIDINRQSECGTALHQAALCGKTEVVRLLLDSGISAGVRNTLSQTALDIVNQFTTTQASREIKQLLRDASAAMQVRALKDYCNNYDLTSLNIKAGDIITVVTALCLLSERSAQRYSCGSSTQMAAQAEFGVYLPLVCVAPRCPHWCCSDVLKWESPEDSAQLSGNLVGLVDVTLQYCMDIGGGSPGLAHQLLATVLSQSVKAKEHLLEQSQFVEQSTTASSSRTVHEQRSFERKTEEDDGKKQAVVTWLGEFQLQFYTTHFLTAGYDLDTISRMTPEDLTAIGVIKPGHRKKLLSEISKVPSTGWLLDHKPANLADWLSHLGLSQYYQVLVQNGYENIDFVSDISLEDLQEIGIAKLGLKCSQTPPHTPNQTPPQTPPHARIQQAPPRARPRPSTQTSAIDPLVPLLRLPCEEEERRRTHSLIGSELDSRYATVCRSSSTDTAAPNDVTVNRSQSSVTLRPRRKGRPPTPPKRSCSSITGGDGDSEGRGLGLLGLPTYRERRASDCGSLGAALRAQDSAGLQRSEGTSGSVRSLAAMLETSMVPRNVGSGTNILQATPPLLRRQAGAGGLGVSEDDVANRRRTVTGLENLPDETPDQLPQQPVKPRPEPRPRSIVATSASEITDATATLRRKPRPPTTESEALTSTATTVITMITGSETICRSRTTEQTESVTHSNNQSNSPEGTKKNVGEPKQNGGVVLRRRPVSEASERTEAGSETCEWMEARKSLKPPVSPKPSTVSLRKTQTDPPTPTRRVPIPGPDNAEPAQSPEPKRVPPPVSPKPRGPPTAPKPGKAAVPSAAASPSPASTSPAATSPTPAPRPFSPPAAAPLPAPDTPSAPSLSPGLPLTSISPAQSPSTSSPHPVKPPRSSIASLSIDLLGGRETEEEEERTGEEEERIREREHQRKTEQEEEKKKRAEDENLKEMERRPLRREKAKEESQEEGGELEGMIQHRLEETSASLAAALHTVEHKIKEEDRPNDKKATVSILDDIGSMFDDLADQLDAMLD
ncbi:hypothetical protein CCH79_00018445 [Gambusia affinis]|uniref:SAM domain-containing protein n=1 Tax=Gambusia affinis TaxID=33528 RepID=A0A315VEJ7_GAMAF|nr:hypothetical protein CCH79_00018445 [Gambusia affinis]